MERFSIHPLWSAASGSGALVRASEVSKEVDALKHEIATQYDLLREPVFRYLITISVRPEEAEDILHEAFLRAYQDLARRPRRNHNVRAWIFRVAHNLAINHMKRKRILRYGFQPRDLDLLPTHNLAPSAEEAVLHEERIECMRAAMADLTAHELRCLQLRAEGLRYREIAEIVGSGITAVAEAVARASRKLAD